MFKNIIFDLSEVIISGYHGMEYLVEEKYGILASEFSKRKQEMIEIFLEAMRGKVKEDEYWNELLEGTNWNITLEDLKTTIRENLNQPVEGTMQIIRKLKNNYQLILLSDHMEEWMEYIKENNQDINIFDRKIFSYDIGSLKSDNQTFERVLKQTQIEASETLFIDDYEKNVNAAQKVGIKGIIFQNAKQLEEELSSKYELKEFEKELLR